MKKLISAFLMLTAFACSPAVAVERIVGADVIEGQSTVKNYIKNSHFEKNVSGVTAYADAAGVQPVDGVGGSPNVTCTRTTPGLDGSEGALLITKDAANRQGQGCSIPFTTHKKGETLRIQVDYAVASGTYADDAIRFYVYDITNSRLIEPSAHKIKNHLVSSGSPIEPMEFQTSIDSSSYRLIMHVAGTDTVAYTIKLDDIKIGKENAPRGPPISGTVAFTPTGSWVTNTTYTGTYRQIGDTVDLHYKLALTGAPNAATLTLNMPPGMVIDLTKKSLLTVLGHVLDSGSDEYPVTFKISGATSFSGTTVVPNGTATGFVGIGNNLNATSPVTFANGDIIDVTILGVPIVGWSSNQLSSSVTSQTSVNARYSMTAPQSISNSTQTILNFSNLEKDSTGSVSTGASWKFTAPISGEYRVSVIIEWAGNVTGQRNLALWKNGVQFKALDLNLTPPSSTAFMQQGTATVSMLAGDYIDVRVFQASGGSLNVGSSTPYQDLNSIYIERMASPEQILATDFVGAKFSTDANQSFSSAVETLVNFEDLIYDSHNAVSVGVGTWKYTCPISGTYRISSFMMFDFATWAATSFAQHKVYRLTSGLVPIQGSVLDVYTADTTQARANLSGATTMKCLTGEILSVWVYQDSGSAKTIANSGDYNHISIERIGNY